MKLNTILLTDGGLETDLIFNKGIELPHFASFPLVENKNHSAILKVYYKGYLDIAKVNKMGFILESPTWRANKDWGYKLGYTEDELSKLNRLAIDQLKAIKSEYKNDISTIYISGNIGPRGDGYAINEVMTVEEASSYHSSQIIDFKAAKADFVSAFTINYINEAMGIVKAAEINNIPVVISFTLETNGDLPSGETIENAILTIDNETNGYPLYYMINCAHPSHFYDAVKDEASWVSRIKGLRCNASCKSHAELDEAKTLDKGDKEDLGHWHSKLLGVMPELKVFGGCCGTDSSHIEAIAQRL